MLVIFRDVGLIIIIVIDVSTSESTVPTIFRINTS